MDVGWAQADAGATCPGTSDPATLVAAVTAAYAALDDRPHPRPRGPRNREDRDPVGAVGFRHVRHPRARSAPMSPRRSRSTASRAWCAARASSRRPICRRASVVIRVGWSSVNYKDGLATRADGKVARISPLIPGIDLAGEVVASDDPAIAVGSAGPRPRLRPRGLAARRLHAVPAGARPTGSCRSRRVSRHATRWPSARPGSRPVCPSSPSRSAVSTRPTDPVLVTGRPAGSAATALAILADRGLRGVGRDRQAGRGRTPDGARCGGGPDTGMR